MWNPSYGSDGFGFSPFSFEPRSYIPKPPPRYRRSCRRCGAPIVLAGNGPGEYWPWEDAKGKSGIHRCNKVATLDEFEVLADG